MPIKGHQFMEKVEWLVEEKYGKLTAMQEIYCWRYALHGNGLRAMRESFNRTTRNGQNQASMNLLRRNKIIERIKHLLVMHHAGEINIEAGPWQHYGDKLKGIGNENAVPASQVGFAEIMNRVNDNIESKLNEQT